MSLRGRRSHPRVRPGPESLGSRRRADLRSREPGGSGPDAHGFTLMELMFVTVLLGVLAMIAVPIYQGFRRDAARVALTEQLRTLAQAQQMHFLQFDVYTSDVDELDYRPAEYVRVELRVAGGGGPGGARPPAGGPRGSGSAGGGRTGGGPPTWAGPTVGNGGGVPTGWAARLTDPNFGVRCAVYHGAATPFEPATVEREIACDEEG